MKTCVREQLKISNVSKTAASLMTVLLLFMLADNTLVEPFCLDTAQGANKSHFAVHSFTDRQNTEQGVFPMIIYMLMRRQRWPQGIENLVACLQKAIRRERDWLAGQSVF